MFKHADDIGYAIIAIGIIAIIVWVALATYADHTLVIPVDDIVTFLLGAK